MSFVSPALVPTEPIDINSSLPKSTREIQWTDVAGIFQSVELPKRSPTSRQQAEKSENERVQARTIFAPYCRKIEKELVDEEESDSEEDLSEEAVLSRHQDVLDTMKAKLAAVMEARKKQQERRKSKAGKTGQAQGNAGK
jgi:hypothetical protein